ncbi:MAG: alpha-glucosidase [Lachnospiraceae bacterium]|nr:alpha-glucosidase [Lachnospiraceae bacterium]
MKHEKDWYKNLVIYQIYPRSFKDGNNDGIGDLKGMTEKLDYLKELGINAIWMSPVYASPNVDNGYDISDYFSIMEEFGTMEDWEAFRDGAHKRGIAIIMDLVLNHTSDQHIWFRESRKSRSNPYADYYVWRDPAPDGSAPTNWMSVFGESAWEYVPERDQYYLHLFAKEQPDLNWDNPEAREKILDIVRFWNEKGVDGYRIDAISYLDKGLDGRSNDAELYGTNACVNLEGTHRYIKEMTAKTMAPDNLMTVGEVNINSPQDAMDYASAASGEFNMSIAFVPPIVEIQTWSPEKLKRDLKQDYEVLKEDGWWARFFSNHDKPRQVSLYGNDSTYWKESAKMLACYLHTLPGTPFIYQGEELGMTNVAYSSIEEYDDIDTRNFYKTMLDQGAAPEEALAESQRISRDNSRTPMQWDASDHAGFSEKEPWLGVNPNYRDINAVSQLQDESSIFRFYQKLIALRREHPVMVQGDLTLRCPEEGPVIAYTRSHEATTWLAVHNFSDQEQIYEAEGITLTPDPPVILSNYDAHNRVFKDGNPVLRPYETILFQLG